MKFCLVVLGLLLSFAPRAADPTVKILHLPEGALVPDVAVDSRGTVHMVYGLNDNAWYIQSADNGKTFTSPVKVNTVGMVTLRMGERGPKIAMGKDGAIHVVYADKWMGPGSKVYPRATRSLDGGKTFQPPKQMGTLFGTDGLTVAADAQGNVLAFFHQITPGTKIKDVLEAHYMYLVRSTDNGVTFAPEERIRIEGLEDLACSMCMMRARIADGSAWLAFRTAVDNIRDFYVLKSPVDKNAFTPLRVNLDKWELKKCPMCGPELTFDPAGRALCAFMSRNRAYWSVLEDGHFKLHAATPAPVDNEIYPAAFGDGRGHVLLAWQVGPMAVGKKATVKWAIYGEDGRFAGQQGTAGVSDSGTKPTAFVGTDGNFYLVTTAK